MPINCDRHGKNGGALVLIHGFPFFRQVWQDQLDLAEQCSLLLPDLPGFGNTPLKISPDEMTMDYMADSVAELLDSMDVAKAAVFGHSMGGYVALAFAERHPERLSALGLIATHPYEDDEETRTKRLNTIDRIKDQGPQVVPASMRENLLSTRTMEERPALMEGVYAIMKNATSEALIAALNAMAARPDRSAVLRSLEVPVLVVAGKKDRILPFERVTEYAEALPSADFHVFSSSGHMPMMEESRQFNEIVAAFVKEQPSEAKVAQA